MRLCGNVLFWSCPSPQERPWGNGAGEGGGLRELGQEILWTFPERRAGCPEGDTRRRRSCGALPSAPSFGYRSSFTPWVPEKNRSAPESYPALLSSEKTPQTAPNRQTVSIPLPWHARCSRKSSTGLLKCLVKFSPNSQRSKMNVQRTRQWLGKVSLFR